MTSCSTHEGTVAGSLIHAGADASIVTNSKIPGLRLTTRASHRAVENGLDMGSILSSLAESLGGVESLICHPAKMTHASLGAEKRKKLGISDGLLRLSVGVEDADDLIAALEVALSSI